MSGEINRGTFLKRGLNGGVLEKVGNWIQLNGVIKLFGYQKHPNN